MTSGSAEVSSLHDEAVRSATTFSEQLPSDYRPGKLDVVCGRGKGVYNRNGNRLMLSIVRKYREQYRAAQTKASKSQTLQTIMHDILAKGIKFMKQKSRKWVVLSERETKVKIGNAVREILSEKEITPKPQEQPLFQEKHISLLLAQKELFQELRQKDDKNKNPGAAAVT